MKNTPNAKQMAQPSLPWWRYPMVWLVIGGPLSVVVAGIATAVIAYQNVDPVLDTSESVVTHPENLPAVRGRNLAADVAMRAQPQPADK
jgi:uncharacterized protein